VGSDADPGAADASNSVLNKRLQKVTLEINHAFNNSSGAPGLLARASLLSQIERTLAKLKLDSGSVSIRRQFTVDHIAVDHLPIR
jgi:hypothetical protein